MHPSEPAKSGLSLASAYRLSIGSASSRFLLVTLPIQWTYSTIMMNTISSYVHMRRTQQPSNCPQLSQPPWLTPALLSQIKRKRDAFSLYKKFPTPANQARYKTERNNIRKLSRSEHHAYANSLTLYSQATTPTSRPTLHTFIRSLRSPPSQRQPTKQLTIQDETFTSPSDIANVFSKQFVAFGTFNNPEWTIPPIADADSTSFFTDIRTTPTCVAKYIKRLKLRMAAGLDGITNELLKILGPSICDPLSWIFDLSFSSGVFPSVWKRSVVVLIYKNKAANPTQQITVQSLLLLLLFWFALVFLFSFLFFFIYFWL